jgi:hypothetical protein
LILVASLTLVVVLFVFDYKTYLNTHAPLAIQGRYLLPIAPLVILAGGLALRKFFSNRTRVYLSIVLIAGLLAGGGIITDIVRSADNWYWPSQTVISVNRDVRNSLHFLTLGLSDTRTPKLEQPQS